MAGYYQGQRGFEANAFETRCNRIFEEEKAAVRFVGHLATEITNEEERAAIHDAAQTDEAGSHIIQAIALYRERTAPDYRNAIKESISAVEATYRQLTGKEHKDIGSAITALENQGIALPSSLQAGFSAIYGWTSGPDGIRHALMGGAQPPAETEARLMLVMCSAYVNYLLSLRASDSR
ncbi:MAG: hypothetical protein OXD33_06425 [Rhodobacteraceae bacterium]|nr:hypothetical protein [Paracoccaceae bacterium]